MKTKLISLLIFTSCLSYRASIPGKRGLAGGVVITDEMTQSQKQYAQTVFPLARANCYKCHDPDGPKLLPGPQFFHADPVKSHDALLGAGKINYSNLESSAIFEKVSSEHQISAWAWTDVETAKSELLAALNEWKPFMDGSILSPNGIKTQDQDLFNGDDISKTVDSVNIAGKKMIYSLAHLGLNGASIEIDVYETPDDPDFYTIENIRLKTGSSPIALRNIAIHVNQVLSKKNQEFSFVSDVVSANTNKKLSVHDMTLNTNQQGDVIGYLRMEGGFEQDSLMITFEKISKYD